MRQRVGRDPGFCTSGPWIWAPDALLGPRVIVGFEGISTGRLGFGVWALTDSMGPSFARIMEQCHVSEPITVIHMAATPQNL